MDGDGSARRKGTLTAAGSRNGGRRAAVPAGAAREVVDVLKEFRDLVTRQTEVTNRIAKTVRVIRDQREPHSELLTAIV